MTYYYVERLCNGLKQLSKLYKKGQKHSITFTFTYKDYMSLLIKENVKHTMHNKIVYNFKGRV